MNVTGKLCQLRQVLRSRRGLHVTHFVRSASAYEGPGKTTVTFLSKTIDRRLMVTHCDETGFTLNTNTKVIGPMVLFPSHVLCWNIVNGKHINDATLSLFTVIEPKPDLLVIGLDEKYDFAYMKNLRDLVQRHNIPAEILAVHRACAVFNFVNEEGRFVVAGLIPPRVPTRARLKLPNNRPKKQITDSRDRSSANSEAASTKADTK